MSTLPQPTSEAPGHAPLEKKSADDAGPDLLRSEALHWQTPWQFAIHACVGSLTFVIVAGSAILLDWAKDWIESVHSIDPVIILGLRAAEYSIFTVDLLLFFIFLLRTLKRTIRHL